MKLNFYKIYGGKAYHSPWILSHFPADYANCVYIEPFLGAGNIPLRMKPAYKEILNDLYYPAYCSFACLQNGSLYNSVRYLPYTQEVFIHFKQLIPKTVLDHAVKNYVLHRMSRGGMKKDFAWSDRLRGGQPGDVNAWENAVSNLPKIAERFKDSIFTCEDAVSLIYRTSATPDRLLYLDPPYLSDTRTSKKVYDLEFDDKQHEKLLTTLLKTDARWLISGYESDMYNDMLGQPCATKDVVLASSQAKKKNRKAEALWKNY